MVETAEQKWYRQKAREAKAIEAVDLIEDAAWNMVRAGEFEDLVSALTSYHQLLSGPRAEAGWAAIEGFRTKFSPESREMALDRLAGLIGVKVVSQEADEAGEDPFEGLV